MILNFGYYWFIDLKDSGCIVYKGCDFLVWNYDYYFVIYDGRYLLF